MIQYNKTLALQAMIHLFGEEGAQMFKKSAVDLNSAFYPQPAFYSQSAVCILHSVYILPLVRSLRFTRTGLFIVCETKFTIGESRTISHANDTQAQQVTPNPRPGRFSTETPLERERRLQIQREQRRRRRQQETAEQKERRLAQQGNADNKRQRNRRLESEAL